MPGDILEKSLSVKNDATVERGRRRSERVALRIPLKMTARLAGGRRICVEVKTQVVNAHGGLLDIGMELDPGQRIMLNNNRGPELCWFDEEIEEIVRQFVESSDAFQLKNFSTNLGSSLYGALNQMYEAQQKAMTELRRQHMEKTTK